METGGSGSGCPPIWITVVWSDDKSELPVDPGDSGFVVDKSEMDISTSVSRFGAGIPVWRVGVISIFLNGKMLVIKNQQKFIFIKNYILLYFFFTFFISIRNLYLVEFDA